MHIYEIGLLPSVFKEMFLMANQVHSYITRNSNIISKLFPVRTNIRLSGIRFQGPKCFNLQSAATISLFKSVSVKRRLRTADCRLRTKGKMQTECKMQTAD